MQGQEALYLWYDWRMKIESLAGYTQKGLSEDVAKWFGDAETLTLPLDDHKLLQTELERITDWKMDVYGAYVAAGVDIVCNRAGHGVKIKVKADAYFGTDPRKIADQGLTFYRAPVSAYAFETISHHVTRDPGWMFNSLADELYYYFLVLGQTEEEVAALALSGMLSMVMAYRFSRSRQFMPSGLVALLSLGVAAWLALVLRGW